MANADGLVSFRALQIANEHRTAYGLRYHDYNRYRNHCANRTHRLRSSLKMTHGKGRDFKKLPPLITDNIKDGHLQLLLFEAERAWSYSQELYTLSLQPANAKKSSTLRHSATGRFRRSVHWTMQLLSHCQSLHSLHRMSSANLVEATAYTLILSGKFLRFRDEYEDSLAQLCVSRELLDTLSGTASTSRDQALATLFADDISPEIRHCAHQLGHSRSYEVDAIVSEISPKHRHTFVSDFQQLVKALKTETHGEHGVNKQLMLQPLVWEGQEVPVRNPELVDVLLEVQKAEAQLADRSKRTVADADPDAKGSHGRNHSRKGVAAFDNILAALSDAEEVAKKLVEAEQSSGNASASASPAGTRDVQFLHSFIVFNLLSKRIERDLALVDALNASSSHRSHSTVVTGSNAPKGSKRDEADARLYPAVVKMLDTVLQSLTHMRSLNIVDESPDLGTSVDVRLAFTKARRCFFMCRSYAAVKQYAEAIVLTQRARLCLREASSLMSLHSLAEDHVGSSFYPLSNDFISQLDALVVSDESALKGDWFAYNGGSTEPLRDPSKKPLFFDIALNYVQLDMDRLKGRAGLIEKASPVQSLKNQAASKLAAPGTKSKADKIERPVTPQPSAPTRSGLSSLLGGWWGTK